jgi:hypothetical protein
VLACCLYEQLTSDDVAFVQALLLEAIDSSYAMSYVHETFEVFTARSPRSSQD